MCDVRGLTSETGREGRRIWWEREVNPIGGDIGK